MHPEKATCAGLLRVTTTTGFFNFVHSPLWLPVRSHTVLVAQVLTGCVTGCPGFKGMSTDVHAYLPGLVSPSCVDRHLRYPCCDLSGSRLPAAATVLNRLSRNGFAWLNCGASCTRECVAGIQCPLTIRPQWLHACNDFQWATSWSAGVSSVSSSTSLAVLLLPVHLVGAYCPSYPWGSVVATVHRSA
jgi:hypothetical protein